MSEHFCSDALANAPWLDEHVLQPIPLTYADTRNFDIFLKFDNRIIIADRNTFIF